MNNLLAFRPSSLRWIPHDIPQPGSESSSSRKRGKENNREKPKRRILSFKPSTEPNHGAPKRRKSVISLTDAQDEELDARTHMQGQSVLFAKLPLELRKMVYEFIMGEETVHLTLGTKKKFGHFLCPNKNSESDGRLQRDCDCKVLVGGSGQTGKLNSACLRVLQVCRRVYHEAASHLYVPHTFSLLHTTHLLYLPTRIPQPRLNTIRTLRLRMPIRALPYLRRGSSKRLAYPEDTANWEKTWAILAGMVGLRDLRVVLLDKSVDGIWMVQWVALEEVLLRPLRTVTRPNVFEVVLPYRECAVEWDMGASKCVLRRPEGAEGEE